MLFRSVSTALTVAMVSGSSLGKYAMITHSVSFSHFTCTSDTFVSLEALLTSNLVRVAAPWDLIPLVEAWQEKSSVKIFESYEAQTKLFTPNL